MNLANKLPLHEDSVQLLLFWRWPLAAACALAALIIEVLERPNLEFGLEAALDIVILPTFLWILITLLAKVIVRHSKLEQKFNLHRQLTESLDRHQDWNELIQFVTKFMGTYLSAEQVSLHVYDHSEARLKFAAEWHTPYGPILPDDPEASEDICLSCWRTNSQTLRRAPEHSGVCSNKPNLQTNVQCLPLSHNKLLVGILRVRLSPGRVVDARQLEFVDSIAPELALSLALSMSQSRQMTQVSTQAHLQERQQIAYELHDSLAQQIAYLHFGLAQMANSDWLADHAPLRQDLAQYRDAARAAYDQVRNIVSDLRHWEATDLADAIATCVQRFEQDAKLDVAFTMRGKPSPLPVSVCQSIVGVVQESLINVQQHARARRVQVRTNWGIENLRIEIDDDGVGFEASSVDDGHWGLIMMRERISRLAGQFEIRSAPGQGTGVTFTIPLKPVPIVEGGPR
jgi:nitrate/nitrite-specific signal transduction histidine kinase